MISDDLRSIEVDGHRIAYRDQGAGDPVVLLHGFLCDSRCWRPQLESLSDGFRVIAWDAPGAGFSSDPPETFTMTDWANTLAHFLDAMNVARAHIVGLSWGGILAQEFYRLHAGRIRSLVLADTYAGWTGSLGEQASRDRLAMCLDHAEQPDAVVADFVPGMFTDDPPDEVRDELTRIISEFHPRGFRLMSISSASDTTDVLPTIDAPTLVLWGAGDRRSPVEVGRELHEAIRGSEFAIIPNAGHVSNLERPAEFDEHVRRFCSRHTG